MLIALNSSLSGFGINFLICSICNSSFLLSHFSSIIVSNVPGFTNVLHAHAVSCIEFHILQYLPSLYVFRSIYYSQCHMYVMSWSVNNSTMILFVTLHYEFLTSVPTKMSGHACDIVLICLGRGRVWMNISSRIQYLVSSLQVWLSKKVEKCNSIAQVDWSVHGLWCAPHTHCLVWSVDIPPHHLRKSLKPMWSQVNNNYTTKQQWFKVYRGDILYVMVNKCTL